MGTRMLADFDSFGVEVPKLMIENISLPPEVEQAMDKRTSMGVIGDLSKYTQFQAAESMKAAAQNPSGTAGAGMGMGMGFAMAQQMGQAFTQGTSAAGGAAPGGGPPPLPGQVKMYVAIDGKQTGPFDLATLAQMARSGQLTRESLVWKDGMAAWSPAGGVSELGNVFGQGGPPPLPR